MYLKELKNEKIILPEKFDINDSCWHAFPIRSIRRNKIVKELKKKKIETVIHYPLPPYKQKVYRQDFKNIDKFDISSKIANEIFSIPINPNLSKNDIEYIIHSIKKILKKI